MLDQKDRHIINSIERDAKITLKRLSKELGMSITAVRKRIMRLEKNRVIEGYKAIINKNFLGISTALVFIHTRDGKYLDVIRALKNYRQVRKAIAAEGDEDIIAVVEGEGFGEVQQAVERIRKIEGVSKVTMSMLKEAVI